LVFSEQKMHLCHTSLLFLTASFLSLVAICRVDSLYFHYTEGEVQCFIEEIPKDTIIMAKWKVETAKPVHPGNRLNPATQFTRNLGFFITLKNPEDVIVLNKVGGSEGRIAHSSQEGGEHQICFQSNSSRWYGSPAKYKMEIDIETGANAMNYDEIAQTEDLDEIQVEIRRLNDQAMELMKEQSYLKTREIEARDESESINSKVMWWSIAETILLIASGFWQVNHLKNYFRKKKIV